MSESRKIIIYKIVLSVVTITMLFFARGWKQYQSQVAVWRGSPVAFSGSAKGTQLFAADGFIVMLTEEDDADKKQLSYDPFGMIGKDGRTALGGKVKVEGFPDFVALPGNIYLLINGHIYQCPSSINAGERASHFGRIE